MADATDGFFDGLTRHGHESLLEKISGSVRFDLTDRGQVHSWLVVIRNGDVTVSRDRVDADSIVHADREVFNEIVSGRANALVAMLRGVIAVEGELELAVLLQRLLPGPPRATVRTPAIHAAGR